MVETGKYTKILDKIRADEVPVESVGTAVIQEPGAVELPVGSLPRAKSSRSDYLAVIVVAITLISIIIVSIQLLYLYKRTAGI